MSWQRVGPAPVEAGARALSIVWLISIVTGGVLVVRGLGLVGGVLVTLLIGLSSMATGLGVGLAIIRVEGNPLPCRFCGKAEAVHCSECGACSPDLCHPLCPTREPNW